MGEKKVRVRMLACLKLLKCEYLLHWLVQGKEHRVSTWNVTLTNFTRFDAFFVVFKRKNTESLWKYSFGHVKRISTTFSTFAKPLD